MNEIRKIERGVILALTIMMALVIVVSTIELGWIIFKDIFLPPVLLIDAEFYEIFGFFLMILIAIELLETIRAYVRDRLVHIEVVLTVALIAIARKVIILDFDKLSGLTLIGIGVIILSTAGAYYLLRRSMPANRSDGPQPPEAETGT
jgi:uncharacterized membrane protein (DUF373 family)